ncbi:hypothetical protein LP422_03600 [Janibacter limosus]|uniref:Uncharacterized protein n=1 Tax=Janibacter limosus TaxID=53458 RepID=A0AC61U5J3_9MICO|nr:hypothetical protein [Janibacter limosus]UUZ45317.1 hypothetical protein LP422_03600 [Janibacter limosus]
MSETGGGCVYNGKPLKGVAARADADGVLELGGPVVAHGYLGRDSDAFTTEGGSAGSAPATRGPSTVMAG